MARIGVVQAGSVLGDTPRTLDKLRELCEACAHRHLQMAVFPEAFIGGYPKGLVFGTSVGIRTDAGRDLFRTYAECAIDVPGPITETIGKAAKDAALYLVVGVIERDRERFIARRSILLQTAASCKTPQAYSYGSRAIDMGKRRRCDVEHFQYADRQDRRTDLPGKLHAAGLACRCTHRA